MLDPNSDPAVIAFRARVQEVEAQARAKADGFLKDDTLARAKGKTPEQIAARKRVAATFCQWHLPNEKPEDLQKLYDQIDYDMPVGPTNGRNRDLEHPKGTGLLGMGRKPAFIQSKAFHPHKPDDPIYCLEYFPLKQ